MHTNIHRKKRKARSVCASHLAVMLSALVTALAMTVPSEPTQSVGFFVQPERVSIIAEESSPQFALEEEYSNIQAVLANMPTDPPVRHNEMHAAAPDIHIPATDTSSVPEPEQEQKSLQEKEFAVEQQRDQPLPAKESEMQNDSPAVSTLLKRQAGSSQLHETETLNTDFPILTKAVFPVSQVPNWGAMHTPEQWNRPFQEMTSGDFIPIPRHDMQTLTQPMNELLEDRKANEQAITAKLFYSTRFFGSYDLDSGEYTGLHAGIDLKLSPGTPVGAIGTGRVESIRETKELGLHAVIEHRLPSGERLYSVYGHLASTNIAEDQDVRAGQTIGLVGNTGNSTSPHLHLQIDKAMGEGSHQVYMPEAIAGRIEIEQHTVHPIEFIAKHRN